MDAQSAGMHSRAIPLALRFGGVPSDLEGLGGVAEAIEIESHSVRNRHEEARELAVLTFLEIQRATGRERSTQSTRHEKGYFFCAVSDPLFICENDAGVIENGRITLLGRGQLAEQVPVLFDPEARDRCELLVLPAVREAVMIVAQAEERVDLPGEVVCQQHGRDPCTVGLERERDDVAHQAGVDIELRGQPIRGAFGFQGIACGIFIVGLKAGESRFDFSDARCVLLDLRFV